MLPVAKTGSLYLSNKYSVDKNLQDQQQIIRENLLILREALADSSPYLLGDFTYADICMAVTLQVIAPIQNDRIMLDNATLQCWSNEDLETEFSDLIVWRETIYQQHRETH